MQTAAIIVQSIPLGDTDIFGELAQAGKISEIRFLPYGESTPAVVLSYAVQSDSVLVFTESNALPALSEALAAESDDFLQCSEDGSGVFTKGKADIFLAPFEAERRRAYMKNVCLPRLKRKGAIAEKIVFRGIGCDKKTVEQCIAQGEKAADAAGNKLEFFVSERYDDTRIEVDYPHDAPKLLIDGITRIFAETFSEELYSMDDTMPQKLYIIDNTTLETRMCEHLKKKKKKISVAESFTGGGVGSRIVSVPGASEVYFEGLNTYNGDAKIKRLNVSPFTLNTSGAVSDQTAYEMCAGLLSSGDCDAAIATTGLAGPKSDESGLPVGLCFLAAGLDGKIYIARHIFTGSRKEITEKAINHALFWAYKHLK